MPASERTPSEDFPEHYQVAVLGLGAMGLPMATRLASRLTVHGFDIAADRLELAAQAGVRPFDSARGAATGADAVLLAVRDVRQLEEVLFGAEGLMNPGRTTNPELEAQLEKVKKTPTDSPDYPALLQEATRIAVTSFPNVFLQLMPSAIARKGVSELPDLPSLRRFEGVKA